MNTHTHTHTQHTTHKNKKKKKNTLPYIFQKRQRTFRGIKRRDTKKPGGSTRNVLQLNTIGSDADAEEQFNKANETDADERSHQLDETIQSLWHKQVAGRKLPGLEKRSRWKRSTDGNHFCFTLKKLQPAIFKANFCLLSGILTVTIYHEY